MNNVRLTAHSIILVLCFANPIMAQPLIFSGDSVILASCEKIPLPIEDLEIYNNTDEDIPLRWERTQYSLPEESFLIMVITGVQYFHYIPHGIVNLEARDSTNIIFYFYHDTLIPGDSVIVQIKVYDPADSINTVKFQTVIQYCPLATSNAEIEPPSSLRIYPNPVSDIATIILPQIPEEGTLALFNITGERVKLFPMTNFQMSFSRDGLPGGIYFAAWMEHGQVSGMTKIVLSD